MLTTDGRHAHDELIWCTCVSACFLLKLRWRYDSQSAFMLGARLLSDTPYAVSIVSKNSRKNPDYPRKKHRYIQSSFKRV